jgi:hypothetical protein
MSLRCEWNTKILFLFLLLHIYVNFMHKLFKGIFLYIRFLRSISFRLFEKMVPFIWKVGECIN